MIEMNGAKEKDGRRKCESNYGGNPDCETDNRQTKGWNDEHQDDWGSNSGGFIRMR